MRQGRNQEGGTSVPDGDGPPVPAYATDDFGGGGETAAVTATATAPTTGGGAGAKASGGGGDGGLRAARDRGGGGSSASLRSAFLDDSSSSVGLPSSRLLPLSARRSLAQPVSSARSTLAQLEAFLHREDSQADLLARVRGEDDDDDSLEDELKRLRDGEDATRLELEGLWLSGAVGGWRDDAAVDGEYGDGANDGDGDLDGANDIDDESLSLLPESEAVRAPAFFGEKADADRAAAAAAAGGLSVARGRGPSALDLAGLERLEARLEAELKEALMASSSFGVGLDLSASFDDGRGAGVANTPSGGGTGLSRLSTIQSENVSDDDGESNKDEHVGPQKPSCGGRLLPPSQDSGLRPSSLKTPGSGPLKARQRPKTPRRSLPLSPLSTEGSLSSLTVTGVDAAGFSLSPPYPVPPEAPAAELSAGAPTEQGGAAAAERGRRGGDAGPSPSLAALFDLAEGLAEALYGRSAEVELKSGRRVAPHQLLAGIAAAAWVLELVAA